jgi:AMMECR1 domain-containing protein
MSNERRQRLLELIRSQGILRAQGAQRIVGRHGQPGRWMLYLYPVSMTKEGMGQLVEEMLRLVEPFEATQLAANGFGAVPLMTAMVQASDGRYTGLVVRPEAKPYGALRRIDGPGDRSRKVVVIDDSISSGTSFRRASVALEDEGYDVEGTACLVDFPGRGGRQHAEARGYRVETSFDIWDDVGMRDPAPLPGYVANMPRLWSRQRLSDGLQPAVAARRVAEHLVDTGEALRPPRTLATPDGDPGGAFVSLRRRDDDRRLARKGFWHFEPGDADPCRDVVIATVQTLQSLPRALSRAELEDLKFCVTFFGPLEQVGPSELDFSRYGIVVRSRVTPRKCGGALPNTQYFTSTWEQYRHARETNAKLMDLEAHDVYRHELVKHVEPGESWPAYGADARGTDGWLDVPGLGDRLLRRVEEVVGSIKSGTPVPDGAAPPPDLLSHDVASVVVGLYGRGTQGCTVGRGDTLDEAIVAAARGAVADRRFRSEQQAPDETISWSVSLLHSPERLGQTSVEQVARKFRRGRDALFVRQGDRFATYVDAVIVQHDWTKVDTARALLKKAGITEGPCTWTTYKTAAWVHTPEGNYELAGGHCRHAAEPAITAEDVSLLAEHLVRRQDMDGWPAYGIRALRGAYVRRGTATRCLHALRVLDLAGQWAANDVWRAAARTGIEHALAGLGRGPGGALAVRDHACGAGAEACLLGAVATSGHDALDSVEIRSLARRVRAAVRPEGCVLAPGVTRSRADGDLFPGMTLTSLASYCAATGEDLGLDWPAIRSWYLRRARLVRPWGLLSWQAQVWDLVGALTGDASHYETTLELCDWMVDHQLSVDGSFLTDMGTQGPGFHTAFVAEGIAAGVHAASALGDEVRAKRLRHSWHAAMAFCDQLLFRRCDTYWTPEPTMVLGAIRATPFSSALRVDFTSHTLQALLNGLASDVGGTDVGGTDVGGTDQSVPR